MLYLDDLYRLTEAQRRLLTTQSDTMKATLSELKTLEAQTEKLVRSAAAMTDLLQQAGRQNEKRRFRLPRLSLPELPTVTLKGAALTLMALVVLAILLFASATFWNNLLKPLLTLLQ